MITKDGLMRLFWPLEPVVDDKPGVLVGWKNSDSDFVVASILPEAQPTSVENALRAGTLFRNSPHPVSNVLDRFESAAFSVIGVINPKGAWSGEFPYPLLARARKGSTSPNIQCSKPAHVQIICYRRPDPGKMQFLSLAPLSLSIRGNSQLIGLEVPPFKEIDLSRKLHEQTAEELVDKLRSHTVKSFQKSEKEMALPQIVSQINCSFDLNMLLQRNIGLVRLRSRRTLSVSERVVESATNLWDRVYDFLLMFWVGYVFPMIKRLFILGFIGHRIIGEAVLLLIEKRLRPLQVALKDVSATAQQVDLRLQQFYYWPIQYLNLKEQKKDWDSISNRPSEYIRFYNSLWLVVNDVIIGMALGLYIIDNAEILAGVVDQLIGTWSLDGLRRILSWLMVYPAGLKLNNELAVFLGDLFIWVIDYWGGWLQTLRPLFPQIIRAFGIASFAGATMPLSLASDLLSLCTLHIYCFYLASARIFGWQLSIISSLFHLFRGKKRNVLRNRIDSCDYELDQLLLGTILFTLLFFLLPTVIVFYLTFAFGRLGFISLKAVFDTMLACLNHFPLFALMLRIKDPGRLPGGVRFQLQDDRRAEVPPSAAIITLKSTPLPLTFIFREYAQLGHQIRLHYFSSSVFYCLATGGVVPPLHRKNLYSLQYSVLPATRVGIGELWRRLRGQPAEPIDVAKHANGAAKAMTANGSASATRRSLDVSQR